MAVARKIVGPQEHYERSGAQSLRDIRPFTTRLSQGLRSSASGFVLAIAAGVTWFEPAVIDATVPLSALYAVWVLTRAPKLPIRLPKSAARRTTATRSPARARPSPPTVPFSSVGASTATSCGRRPRTCAST